MLNRISNFFKKLFYKTRKKNKIKNGLIQKLEKNSIFYFADYKIENGYMF